MKNILAFLIISTLSHTIFAGPFVAGGNGAMSLAYCNSEKGDFGANVSRDIGGDLFGYSWTNDQEVSAVTAISVTAAKDPGTPQEKPMIFRSKNFQIRIFMGNLPAEVGAPIYRVGDVIIKKNKKWLRKSVSCTLFGIGTI